MSPGNGTRKQWFIRDNIIEKASGKLLGEKGFAEFVSSADLTDDDVGYTELQNLRILLGESI